MIQETGYVIAFFVYLHEKKFLFLFFLSNMSVVVFTKKKSITSLGIDRSVCLSDIKLVNEMVFALDVIDSCINHIFFLVAKKMMTSQVINNM